MWFILPKSRPLSSTSTMSARASLWLWLILGRFKVKRPSDGERIDNLRPARGQSWGQGAVSSAVGRDEVGEPGEVPPPSIFLRRRDGAKETAANWTSRDARLQAQIS